MNFFLSSTDFIQDRFHDFLINVAEREIQRFRDNGRPFETHNSLTPSWALIPYSLCPATWFTFYHAMRDYVGELSESYGQIRMMYIHGTVTFPTNIIPYQHIRRSVYDMFFLNIPHKVTRTHTRVRFRLLFVGASWVGDRMSIDNISCRAEYSPPFYRDNYFER